MSNSQRTIGILSGLLALQLALAALLGLRSDRLAPAAQEVALIGAELKEADRLTIDGPAPAASAARVELVRRDGSWRLPGYHDAPADGPRVQELLDRLAGLKRGLPVATSEAALERFKVGERDYERRLVAGRGGTDLATLYVGISPGLRQAHARSAGDRAVYSVALAAYELPTGAADWLDRGLLKRDTAALQAIDVAQAGQPAFALKRVADAAASAPAAAHWQLDGRRVDDAKAKALLDAIGGLRVDGIAGTQPPAGTPALTLVLHDAQGQTSWTLTKAPAADDYLLRTSDRPWTFELKAWSARPLLEAAPRTALLGSGAAKSAP